MTAEQWLWSVFWFCLGASLGSFYMVVGLRLPARKSVVHPPSACPNCGVRIRGVDLMPIAGWLWRRGKCGTCRSSISVLYPLAELATGLGFWYVYYTQPDAYSFLAGLVLLSQVIVLTVSDLKYRLLPNRLVYPAFAFFLVYRAFVHPLPIWQYALGFAIGGGTLWLISWASQKAGKPGMGGGDIKWMAALGLAVGAEQIVLIILVSSFAGLLAGVLLIAGNKMSRRSYLPFGPFIGVAAIVSWFWGGPIVDAYLQLYTYA